MLHMFCVTQRLWLMIGDDERPTLTFNSCSWVQLDLRRTSGRIFIAHAF